MVNWGWGPLFHQEHHIQIVRRRQLISTDPLDRLVDGKVLRRACPEQPCAGHKSPGVAHGGLRRRGHEAGEHDPQRRQELLEVPYLIELLDD